MSKQIIKTKSMITFGWDFNLVNSDMVGGGEGQHSWTWTGQAGTFENRTRHQDRQGVGDISE